MKELMCYILPASVGTLIISHQFRKMESRDLVLLYLSNMLFTNIVLNVLFQMKYKQAEIKFTMSFVYKYLLIASVVSFVFGIVFCIIAKRFSLKVEVESGKKNK